MSNFLANATAWLAGQLKSHAPTAITYERGAESASIDDAVVGETLFKAEDPSVGNTVYLRSRDFLVFATDLVLGGVQTTPERNDKILETRDGTTYVHTVLPFNDEPVWRWSDPHRTMLRIHTKQTGTL